MAKTAYQPFGDTQATGPSGNLLHTSATPAAFGGQEAEALSKMGADLKSGANDLEKAALERMSYTNELYASDQSTVGMQRLASRWGEYGKLEGKSAHDALPTFQQDVERIYKETVDEAPNAAAKAMLAKSLRNNANWYTRTGENHATREFRTWADRSATSRAQEFGNQAFLANQDPVEMRRYLDQSDASLRKVYEDRGWDEEAIQSQTKQNRGRNLSNIVGALAVDDPVRAAGMFREYADQIDANSQRTISNTLKPYLQQTAAREIGDVAMGKGSAAQRKFGGQIDSEIEQSASAAGVDPTVLRTIVRLESGGDPKAQKGSYKGLGQMSDGLFQKYGGGDIFDAKDNLRATARKTADEIAEFRDKYGREPSATDIYLTHQQGAGGYGAHLARPDAKAWENMASTAEGRKKGEAWAKAAIWGNVPDDVKAKFGSVENVTSADFINVWRRKVEGIAGGPLPDRAEAVTRAKELAGGNPTIQDMAVNHVNRQYQQIEAENRVEAFKLGEQVKSDLASMSSTGQGVPGIDPNRVSAVLGPIAAQKWQAARSDAYVVHQATTDLYSLSEPQIQQRLASLQPPAGDAEFTRKQGVYDAVKERADALRKERNDDPASSVARDPAVQAATKGMDGAQPSAIAVANARMTAQEKAGIPEDNQSPITKAEAQALTVPLRRMLPGEERETLTAMAEDFKARFGEHADVAFAYALRINKVDKETAQIASRLVTKLGLGQVEPSVSAASAVQSEARMLDQRSDIGASERIMSIDPMSGVPMWAPEGKHAPEKGANVPAAAIKYLRDNPQSASSFDRQYGSGLAKKVLEKYPAAR